MNTLPIPEPCADLPAELTTVNEPEDLTGGTGDFGGDLVLIEAQNGEYEIAAAKESARAAGLESAYEKCLIKQDGDIKILINWRDTTLAVTG